jgi:hypothetical protein
VPEGQLDDSYRDQGHGDQQVEPNRPNRSKISRACPVIMLMAIPPSGGSRRARSTHPRRASPRGVQVVPAFVVASGRAAGRPGRSIRDSRCAVSYWLAVLTQAATRPASPGRSAGSSSGAGMATTGQVAWARQ